MDQVDLDQYSGYYSYGTEKRIDDSANSSAYLLTESSDSGLFDFRNAAPIVGVPNYIPPEYSEGSDQDKIVKDLVKATKGLERTWQKTKVRMSYLISQSQKYGKSCSELAQKSEQLTELEQKYNKLGTTYELDKKRQAFLQEQLDHKNEEFEKNKEDLAQARKEISTLGSQLSDSNTARKTEGSAIIHDQRLSDRILQLEAELQTSREEATALKTSERQARYLSEQSDNKATALENEVARLSNSSDQKLSDFQITIQASSQALATMESAHKKLKKELDETKKKLAETQDAGEILRRENAILKLQLDLQGGEPTLTEAKSKKKGVSRKFQKSGGSSSPTKRVKKGE